MAHSNYADKPVSDNSGAIPQHRLNFGNDARAYTPFAGERDGEGLHGNLATSSTGDPFWKPQRYPSDKGWTWSREMIDATYPDGYVPNVRIVEPAWRTDELEAQMPTFKGVPPSPAELYRGQVFTRA